MKTLLFPENEQIRDLAQRYRYDPWLISRFTRYVPNIDSFLLKMERPPSRYIRVNTLKISADALVQRLSEKGFRLARTSLSEVYSVEGGSVSIGATTEYMLGHYYIQDLSSCFAVEAMDLEQGQLALDMASAPGGKTSLMAQKMQNDGCIIALEPNKKRIRSMSFNLARLGVQNVGVCALDGIHAGSFGPIFDRVLLDAPCSCEGVIARDPSRKQSHTPEDVQFCSEKQTTLISAAVSALKPGGILVYSTCSFAPEENEAVVSDILEKFDEIDVEPISFGVQGITEFGGIKFDPRVKETKRFYPHIDDTTGFFIAKMRKAKVS